jgi:Ca-activated chloride channel family protein
MTARLLSLLGSLLLRVFLFLALLVVTGCAGAGEKASRPPSSSGAAGSSAGPPLPPSNAGDRYVAVGTNPFVATAHDPLSTFATDVDTASYDIFRRDVNLDLLPQADSVRLEEYVNDFAYAYPAPAATDTAPFAISLAAAANVFDRPSALLRVGIQAAQPPPTAKRPANLVFLVDVSGSMQSPDKLGLVQRILRGTLEVLEPTDTVSVVTYAGSVGVRLEPTPIANSVTITKVIDGLTASGSTAGASGLTLAYQQAHAGFIEGGINHILLCTDGDFNVGPSSTADLLKIVKQEREGGVTLTTLGFGIGNLNDGMMEAVSDAGNGIYGVISSETQADSYLRDRMLSTIVRVANNMKVQVAFNPAKVTAYRLLGYEDRAVADEDFRNDAVDGGEVGAGHRVTALYEMILAGQAVPTPQGAPALLQGPPVEETAPIIGAADLVQVAVRWQSIGSAQDAPAHEVSAALPAETVCALDAADADLRWAAAVAAFAEILKGSPFADRAALPTIEAIVTEQKGHDAGRAEFAILFAKARMLMGL